MAHASHFKSFKCDATDGAASTTAYNTSVMDFKVTRGVNSEAYHTLGSAEQEMSVGPNTTTASVMVIVGSAYDTVVSNWTSRAARTIEGFQPDELSGAKKISMECHRGNRTDLFGGAAGDAKVAAYNLELLPTGAITESVVTP